MTQIKELEGKMKKDHLMIDTTKKNPTKE